jgi:hypothetical protein
LTLEHAILSNLLQTVAAAAWLGIAMVILIAGKEIKRFF